MTSISPQYRAFIARVEMTMVAHYKIVAANVSLAVQVAEMRAQGEIL
jgi:hypothetical protein